MTFQIPKATLLCHEVLIFVQDHTPEVFGTTHLENETLANSRNADKVFLFCAAQHHLTSPDRSKGDFSFHTYYKARTQYETILQAHISELRSRQSLFGSSGFDRYLDFELTFSKSPKNRIKILDVITNAIRSLRWGQRKRMTQFEHRYRVCQKTPMNRMRTVFPETYLNVRFSSDCAAAVVLISRQPDIQSATSASCADLIVTERFGHRLHTTHSASRPLVQYG